ncbi:hypothetical protein PM032_00540 [Halorubrum ezzemoulense]|uniref:hypothetical protein n=1 Tax=Halorubrum ezzemoulense TaxID=337243 RepID=UPI002330FCAD|nr:hypothetical protein [Halorubrum ezzemoulense]MDB2269507.1 hypothetical protein [Halorubrum ezzemoulense]
MLYEYCVKNGRGAPEDDTNIGWDSRDGIYGRVRRKLRKGKRHAELELRRYDTDDLTPEKVSEIFIEKFEIQEAVVDKVENYFSQSLDSDCDIKEAREKIDEVVNAITTTAAERKSELSQRTKCHHRSQDHPAIEHQLCRLIYHENVEYGPDAGILTDAHDLKSRGIVSKVVTGDKGDMYLNSKEIKAITGVTVLYLKDEFAGETTHIPK